MLEVQELSEIDELDRIRPEWARLLALTHGAGFFQSLEWLEVYWRHFGSGQKLRVLGVTSGGNLVGILPLVVRIEDSKVGRLRVLTYPLHDWSSFYGPIGPEPEKTLAAGLAYLQRARRDWDVLDLRWQGGPDTEPACTGRAMCAAGFQAYPTIWDWTHVVDVAGTWESYWSARKALGCAGFATPSGSSHSKAKFRMSAIDRAVRPTVMALPGGTCMTLASKSPNEVGRVPPPTGQRSRIQKFAVFYAILTKLPQRRVRST